MDLGASPLHPFTTSPLRRSSPLVTRTHGHFRDPHHLRTSHAFDTPPFCGLVCSTSWAPPRA
eukprot:11824965-Alexandrium_andersonii.AAC.1